MADDRHFRAWPRRRAESLALVRLLPHETASSSRLVRELRARLVDVGLGGAGVSTEPGVLVGGDRVEVVLHAPNRWDPLLMPGRVAWSVGSRAGIAFEARDERDVYALFELLGTQVFEG
jgi:cobalamin biosynthesis Mg chelatase CobN